MDWMDGRTDIYKHGQTKREGQSGLRRPNEKALQISNPLTLPPPQLLNLLYLSLGSPQTFGLPLRVARGLELKSSRLIALVCNKDIKFSLNPLFGCSLPASVRSCERLEL